MAIPFCPGYDREPFATLVANYPGKDVHPLKDFRVEWGPIFHRGRLDGTARILVIGQDPAQHETVVRRILVGTAGKRVHGFLRRLGFNRSYVLINTFLYSVFGQGGGARQIKNAAITAYRNQWIKAILDSSPIEAVVAFGGLAKQAWEQWLASADAAGRPALPFEPLTHPTWPESSSKSKAEHDAAIETLLSGWNGGLQRLKPKITHPDLSAALSLYGKKFLATDLPDLPPDDLPAGLPEWMLSEESWADREGTSSDLKRRTIIMRAPKSAVQ
jgi:Uracil DNA glycosylase superfamily